MGSHRNFYSSCVIEEILLRDRANPMEGTMGPASFQGTRAMNAGLYAITLRYASSAFPFSHMRPLIARRSGPELGLGK